MALDPALSLLAEQIESEMPWPRPRCPRCQAGYISFPPPEDIEDHESASLHHHVAFEPDWIHGSFIVRGRCDNAECNEVVIGTGTYRVDYSQEADPATYQGVPYSRFYKLNHLHPALPIMTVPQSAPAEVGEAVMRASRVLFVDAGLAATALRATVERFLTSQGISSTSSKGRFLTAHDRIEDWRSGAPDREGVADLLSAVRWLGNAGTHEDSDLSVIEVLEGAEVLDEAFHRLYKGADLDMRAKSINAAKGPLRGGNSAPPHSSSAGATN